jgi:hypothetical protein
VRVRVRHRQEGRESEENGGRVGGRGSKRDQLNDRTTGRQTNQTDTDIHGQPRYTQDTEDRHQQTLTETKVTNRHRQTDIRSEGWGWREGMEGVEGKRRGKSGGKKGMYVSKGGREAD